MDSIKPARKYGLDFLKGIAACFVVFMHVRFPDPSGNYIATIGTFAVPVFFMTSGFFALNAARPKIIRALKRTFMYLVVALLLNCGRILIGYGFDMHEFSSFFIENVFTLDHLWKFVILSHSKISGVAWFLISLLMCYLLKYLFGRRLRFLAYLGIIFGVISVLPPISGILRIPINNPWINGVPFFIIGEILHEKQEIVNRIFSNSFLVLLSCIGLMLSILACYFSTQWWYIGTLLLSPGLFILFNRCEMKFNRVCLLGSVYAFFIYIIHPLVMHAYDAVRTDQSMAEMWARPVIVLLFTVLMAWIYYSAKRYFVKK